MITLIKLQAPQNLYSPKLKQLSDLTEFENYEVDPLMEHQGTGIVSLLHEPHFGCKEFCYLFLIPQELLAGSCLRKTF